MSNKEFNLQDEKWILLRKSDCSVEELSLMDALLQAHQYMALSGELPTQDISILRLLLAVLHTVFARYAPDGTYSPLTKPADAMQRWNELWNAGKFPEKPIREYLASQHERFWLFHPDRPFYQTNAAKAEPTKASFPASKLNAEISDSNNKKRLFPLRNESGKKYLSYSEAARWLIHLNGFDDASNERGKSKLIEHGIGVSWLGELGLIWANGDNLFETLMLNLVLLDYRQNTVWKNENPVWEKNTSETDPRLEIAQPDNMSCLYTLLSRRILLDRTDNMVSEFHVYGGDYFDKEDCYIEQMTAWSGRKIKKGIDVPKLLPYKMDASSQAWREFPIVLHSTEGNEIPAVKGLVIKNAGIVSWIDYLRFKRSIDRKKYIAFKFCSFCYDGMKSCCTGIYSDSLTFHTDLITELGKRWRKIISKEVLCCEDLAYRLKLLATDVEIAAGASPETAGQCSSVIEVKEQFFYHEIDIPFRTWLASIDPEWEDSSDEEQKCLQSWHETALRIAMQIGRNVVEEAGDAAVIGRLVSIKKDKSEKTEEVYYSAAKAYNDFSNKVFGEYKEGKKHG